MCGVAGAIGGNPEELEAVVSKMTGTLTHRGPDTQKVIANSHGALGHTRLSIIDTSEASNQPFSTDQKNWLTYNGELYNYRSLKSGLEAKGISFSTSGDTEVLYRLWNLPEREQLLAQTTGMFAFGFWDDENRKLQLARDRMGIKPLYYALQDGVLYFASELRAMMQAGFRSLNHEVLGEFLTFQAIPGEQTLLKEVMKVPPGSILEWDPEHQKLNTRTYFDFSDPDSDPQQTDDPENLVRQAVSDRMVSDVPIGAFLSGGIDSTLVVAMMREQAERDINTFTLSFDQPGEDERDIARKAAEHLQTRHHEIICTEQQVLEDIPVAVQNLDVPGGDAVNTWLIARHTREQGVKVALSGLGGDELFGGYPSFEFYRKIRRMRFLLNLPQSVRAMMAGLIFRGDAVSRRKLRELFAGQVTPAQVTRAQRTVLQRDVLNGLGVAAGIPSVPERIRKHRHIGSGLTVNELYSYCLPLLLQDTDQTSMAHGLEVRVPLLDHRLVSWVLNNPEKAQSMERPPKKKLIEMLRNRVPREIWDRPKQGFVLPMDRWMRAPLKSFTEEGLQSKRLRSFCDQRYLDEFYGDFLQEEKSVTWSRIWLLSVLGHWLEQNRITC